MAEARPQGEGVNSCLPDLDQPHHKQILPPRGQKGEAALSTRTSNLSADEMRVLKFAVRRQLARSANKRNPNPDQRAQRAALQQVVRILKDAAFTRGCDLLQHNRWGRSYRDDAALAARLGAVLGSRTYASAGASRALTAQPLTAQRYSAHACRDGAVLCGRVELTVRADTRLGLTPREQRRLAARFVEHLHPALREELAELVRRRGAVARRAAERMDPIELVVDDPDRGLQRVIGWLQPPQRRHGDLHEIEFDLRELEPAP